MPKKSERIKRVAGILLLQSLDARNGIGITLAATNHEHLLDMAVWRRFDARIEMPKLVRRKRASNCSRTFSSQWF